MLPECLHLPIGSTKGSVISSPNTIEPSPVFRLTHLFYGKMLSDNLEWRPTRLNKGSVPHSDPSLIYNPFSFYNMWTQQTGARCRARTMELLVNGINSVLSHSDDSGKAGDMQPIQSQLNRNGWDIYSKAVQTLNKIWEALKQMCFYSSELKLVR